MKTHTTKSVRITIPAECIEPLERAAKLSGLSIQDEAKEALIEHLTDHLVWAPVANLRPFMEALAEAIDYKGSLPEMVRETCLDTESFVRALSVSMVNSVPVSPEQKDAAGAVMLRTLEQLKHTEWIRRNRSEAEACLGPLMIG